MPTGPTTNDGRCWACAQRRRYHPAHVWQENGEVRHAVVGASTLCSLPRKPKDQAVLRQRQRDYYARQKAAGLSDTAESKRRRRLKWAYGITPEEVDAMVLAQGGVCACCKIDPATEVDHDHDTGAVRGVLCGHCNRMLGLAKDDPERLIAGADYLARSAVRSAS